MRIRRLAQAGLFAIASAGGSAAASAEPASLSGTGDALAEAGFELDIRFRGLVAEVSAHQALVNRGEGDALAVYTFSLPAEAAVTGLSVELPGDAAATALAVDAAAAVRPVPRPDATDGEPDIGLLRIVRRTDSHATYELRVFPVPAGGAAQVVIDWAAPLEVREGRLALRIPDRGGDDGLSREQIKWRIEPPLGASGIEGAFSRGSTLDIARRGRDGRGLVEIEPFSAPVTGDLVIEAVVGAAGGPPRASYGVYELEGGLMAVAGSAYHPREPPRRATDSPSRILIVADISRSMGAAGALRAAEIVEAALDAADAAEVDAIVFDRRARRVFGELRRDGPKTRRALRRAIAPAERENGTDLLAALELARPLLEGDEPPDVVFAISDDVWPTKQTAAGATAALGRRALSATEILGITLVPDRAATPGPDAGPLARLAHASGGLALTLRHGEVETRAPHLLGELVRPSPVVGTAFVEGGRRFEPLAMPDSLASGHGVATAGFHRAAEAPALSLVARRGGRDLQIESDRSEVLDRLAFPLAAARHDPSVLLPLAPAADGAPDPETRALRALHRAALESPVVTPHTSLVIPGQDELAEVRIAGVTRWGSWLYRRMPPPPERAEGHALRAFEATLDTGGRPASRPTGQLSRSAIKRALEATVPRARHCYRRVLRRDSEIEGSLTLAVELSRGEVLAARAEEVEGLPRPLADCVASAAYAVRIPRVALGDQPEALITARYPLEFRGGGVRANRLEVPGPAAPPLDPTDPLGGMPERR